MRAITLMYHDVIEEQSPQSLVSRRLTPYSLSYRHFCNHLDAIARKAAIQTIENGRRWANGIPIFLTFDDGDVSAYTCSARAMEDRHCRGHYFITTDWIGRPGFMSPDQIRELRARGHVIGSHSCSHPERMSHLSAKELMREWSASCSILSGILSEQVKVASVPAGYYSRKVGKAAAAAGIEVLFTSEPTSAITLEGGCLILGRYCIQGHMPARITGDISAGLIWPRWRQSTIWQAKKFLKVITGESYFVLRSFLLARLGRQSATAPSLHEESEQSSKTEQS